MFHVCLYIKHVKYAHELAALYAEFVYTAKRSKRDEHLRRQ